MTLSAAKVLVGTADQQKTTGAIRNGALIDEVPQTFEKADEVAKALTSSGYVSEDGIELATDISTSDIREMNHSIVRKLLDSFDGTIAWSLIQSDYESWCQALGEEYVEKVAATAEHGEQLHIRMGAHLGPVQSWAFCLKDGDARIIVVVPRGQVTTLDSITFNASDPISLPVTLSCYDDGTGDAIHIFQDDGKKLSVPATGPESEPSVQAASAPAAQSAAKSASTSSK